MSNLPRIHFSRLLLIAAALLLMLGLAGCIPPLTSVPAATETPPEPPTQQLPTATQEPVLPPTPTEEPAAALLDPLSIPKFAEALVIPPVMPPESAGDVTKYSIAVRQFEQQILPAGFPKTTVWGYGRLGDPLPGSGEASTFNFPSFTIEARQNEKMQVNWVNQLVDDPDSANPHFLPHLLPVDQTVHWANPGPQGILDPAPYHGPVPIVTHVHGAHVGDHSDGNPEAWYMPDASDMPAGYLTQGEHYASQGDAGPGGAIFEYTNDWRAATLWYHDHTLGMTRLNVYAGMAGFWLLRDDVEDSLNLPGPAPKLGDAPGTKYYEIPIAIQDRSFNADGSLYYPASREAFDGYAGPYMPDTPVSPIWNPEFFGNTMVVNGKTWPYLEVEPRLYRLRLLNGNNSRFLILKFDKDLVFHQIGVEGGLLPDAPVVLQELLLGPAERADVIVDFSTFKPGDEIVLLNLGPDGPFAELPVPEDELADPETTGQVMQFRVVEGTDQGNAGVIPEKLPAIERLASDLPERDLTLNEMMYKAGDEELPAEAIMGTGREGPREYFDAITENPMVGDTEIWRVVNLTPDSHPIHLHLVMFQVLDRIPFDEEAYKEAQKKYLDGGAAGDPPDPLEFATGEAEPRHSWETGWKDTVIAAPGHVTRIIANFDLGGLYVWHCHILEHEDNEMMRPFFVGPMP